MLGLDILFGLKITFRYDVAIHQPRHQFLIHSNKPMQQDCKAAFTFADWQPEAYTYGAASMTKWSG